MARNWTIDFSEEVLADQIAWAKETAPWDNSAESRKETPSKNSEEVESSPKTEEDEYTTEPG